MGREIKNVYCFICDENKRYYRAVQQNDGNYLVTKSNDPYPLTFNPDNLLEIPSEAATNKKYNSPVRSITHSLNFIKDGAAILRKFYYLGKGVNERTYLYVVEWDGASDNPKRFNLAISGRIDFSQKDENPEDGSFTVPLVDESAWGVLSRYDTVEFAFDCSPTNPKAVKVLVDGLTLKNTFAFQTVESKIVFDGAKQFLILPLALINQDGDSYGVISKTQSLSYYADLNSLLNSQSDFFRDPTSPISQANFSGSYSFICSLTNSQSYFFEVSLRTNKGQQFILYKLLPNPRFTEGERYDFSWDININLEVDERLFFAAFWSRASSIMPRVEINIISTNIKFVVNTTTQPQIVYGLRAPDLLQQIVNKATQQRYTIGSTFSKFNNDICISGDALRQVPNAELYTSFEDFFETFNSIYWTALITVNSALWFTGAADLYMSNNPKIIDIGEAISAKLSPAMEHYANEVVFGSPKQELNHPSGRFAFNSTNSFSVNIQSSDKKLSLVTKYITDCFAIQFLIIDYKGESTKDNRNDKKVFLLRITDEQATAVSNIETFENVTIDNVLLEPIIKYPLANQVITNDRPKVRGTGIKGNIVNIYVDTVLDGSAVVDANGNWSYVIANHLVSYSLTQSGIHLIQSTYSDLSGVTSSISITVDTTFQTQTKVLYPSINDNIYNNKPLIKGVAQHDTNINIFIDTVLVLSTVADESGYWEYKCNNPLSNGNHQLNINNSIFISFNVDSNVSHPLITYIDGELDGFTILNNLPLIQGVSKPFEYIKIWLDYISYRPLGETQADQNGNWSYQVVAVNFLDPLGGVTVLAPIKNGLNVISTSLDNFNVGINVSGYKLERPAFNSITGVLDNTVFNTAYTPKRMLKNHYPKLAAMLHSQPQEYINAQTFGQNGNLVTILGNEVISERSNISASELGKPFAILENVNLKVKARKSFIKSLDDFSKGAILKSSFRGKDLFFTSIGSLRINSLIDTEQEWNLLLSTLTTYQDLLTLYKKGINITIMKKSLYHSDRNSIHMVEYNYQANPKFDYKTIYQDWFNNRNTQWLFNPDYIQKYQTSETDIVDQIITNGLVNITLRMYRCRDASFVASFDYSPVNPAPISAPEIVLEAKIDFSKYPEDQYFFVMMAGEIPVMISERIQTRAKWHKTILIQASSSLDEPGAFFSTGFKTIIRVEGLISKEQPKLSFNSSRDDIGNYEMLSGTSTRQSEIRFGTAYGLPDYLYLKVADSLILDRLNIENRFWTLEQKENIQKSEDVSGHPMYYYTALLTPNTNVKGATVAGADGADLSGVVIVVDPTAIGMPVGSLINIELTNG